MKGLPVGYFLPGNSPLHRMNAGVKIICLFLLLIAVICTSEWFEYVVLLLFTVGLIRISGIGFRVALRSVWQLRWFFCMIFLMNLFFFQSRQAWFRWWIFQPSLEGAIQGVHTVARVAFVLVYANLLQVTTPPLEITHGLEWILSPLSFIGVPTDLVAMILSVAIRFIPVLSEEADTIRKAQMARGAKFDSQRWADRGKAVIPLVVPIFLAAFKRADEMSLAMEARGYQTDLRRRKRYNVRLCLYDRIGLASCAAAALFFIIL